MKRGICFILGLFILSCVVMAQESAVSVAERNAAQGFNDTIDRLDSDFVLVSLCIADPTDQSQDYLGIAGHAFLRLQCPTFGLDYCFSYESEKLKGQLLDYMFGKLRMGMFAVPTAEYIEDYRIWKRAVHEYRLHMPPEAEQRLWEQMDNHLMAEHDMQMNIVKFGCANTILRYVERALLPDTLVYQWPEKYLTMSAMKNAEEHFCNYPWTMFGLRLTARKEYAKLTTPKQKVIFPTDLVEVWLLAMFKGEPFLTYIGDLVEAEPVVVTKPWFTPQVSGILLLVLIVSGCVTTIIVRRRKNNNHQS